MTPTEQDKELRLEIARKVYPKPTPREVMSWGTQEAVIEMYSDAPIVHKFANFITADRERVALEARIDELSNAQDELFKGAKMTWFTNRRVELKAQLEEL